MTRVLVPLAVFAVLLGFLLGYSYYETAREDREWQRVCEEVRAQTWEKAREGR